MKQNTSEIVNLKLLANKVFLRSLSETPIETKVKHEAKKSVSLETQSETPKTGVSPLPETVIFYDDGRDRNTPLDPPLDTAFAPLSAAALWLHDRLKEPRRVAEVIAEWTGGEQRKQPNGALRWEGGRHGEGERIAELNAAARCLGVEARIGPDDRWWWTCPDLVPQAKDAA